MKRITITTFIFILIALSVEVCFAEEETAKQQHNESTSSVSEAQTESNSAIASETLLLEEQEAELLNNTVQAETENTESEQTDETDKNKEQITEEDNLENKEEDSESLKQPEQQEQPNKWIEKSTGKQLNSLKRKLEELQKLYNINYKTFKIGDAINSFEKADTQQKRNNSLLLDVTKQQPFTIYATTYVFPELLKLNIEKNNAYLLNVEKTLTDEIKDTNEEIDELINKISDLLDSYNYISKVYKNLVLKEEKILTKLRNINSKTNNLTKFGYYIKNTNKNIIDIIQKQINSMNELIEQLDIALEYSKEQIKYIKTHNHSIPVKGKYIAEIRSSFKDFEKYLESYDNKQDYNYYLLSTNYSNRYDDVEKLIGKEEIREGRIKSHIKSSKFFNEAKSICIFNAKDELTSIFDLFEFSDVNTELYNQLIGFISDESWYSRYKDETEADKATKDSDITKDNKKKPKLIDFEEDL